MINQYIHIAIAIYISKQVSPQLPRRHPWYHLPWTLGFYLAVTLGETPDVAQWRKMLEEIVYSTVTLKVDCYTDTKRVSSIYHITQPWELIS